MCRKHLFVFSFGCIAAIGLFNVTGYGLASLKFYSVQNTISAWQSNKESQSEASYIKAKKAIIDARKSHPAHPLYMDLAAQLYEWGTLAEYEKKSVALAMSKRYYLKAAKMRPTWPVTYASLAMNKWRSNEFDEELGTYLRLANKYGPKKAEVNILYSEMGLALYKSNHPFYAELRPHIKQKLSQGLRNNQSRDRVLKAIEYYEAKRTACRWMKGHDPYVANSIIKCNKTR